MRGEGLEASVSPEMAAGFTGIEDRNVGTGLRDSGRSKGFVPALSVTFVALALTGCGMQTQKVTETKRATKEYFAESEYGVKASPRVTTKASRLPRGGGRAHVGKPYKVKGQWYRPQEVASSYRASGKASWYGDAFHGRLTANGEIYDMTHLTAAHPTLPLPSYARVTNLENGNSVVVRINDRGPFSRNRVIDLSKRAAQMLDYTHRGVADVQVEYMGPAPLHGQDDEYLLASFRPGGTAPDPSDGLPSGVMIAMAGPTPDGPSPDGPARVPPPSIIADNGDFQLPELAPIPEARPSFASTTGRGDRLALSYAPSRPGSEAGAALERLVSGKMQPQDVIRSWLRQKGSSAGSSAVFIGNFDSPEEARKIREELSGYGSAEIEHAQVDGKVLHGLTIHAPVEIEAELLRHAWAMGATDAFRLSE